MPLIKYLTDRFPGWSEVAKVEQLNLNDDTEYTRNVTFKAALFVIQGNVTCYFNNAEVQLPAKAKIFISSCELIIKSSSGNAEVFIIYGNWGDDLGNSGLFTVKNSSSPRNIGDPVKYPRATDFDNHFHDCDEYWFILKGRGVAYSEGIQYNFMQGDCIATKTGEHHDLPEVTEEIYGLYFETTLKGLKRKGHLWQHTHPVNISRDTNEL